MGKPFFEVKVHYFNRNGWIHNSERPGSFLRERNFGLSPTGSARPRFTKFRNDFLTIFIRVRQTRHTVDPGQEDHIGNAIGL
jgi:hypothetical protein